MKPDLVALICSAYDAGRFDNDEAAVKLLTDGLQALGWSPRGEAGGPSGAMTEEQMISARFWNRRIAEAAPDPRQRLVEMVSGCLHDGPMTHEECEAEAERIVAEYDAGAAAPAPVGEPTAWQCPECGLIAPDTCGEPQCAPGTPGAAEGRTEDAEYLSADAEQVLEVFKRQRRAGVPEQWAMEDAIRILDRLRAFTASEASVVAVHAASSALHGKRGTRPVSRPSGPSSPAPSDPKPSQNEQAIDRQGPA